jgi:hypothetical protein
MPRFSPRPDLTPRTPGGYPVQSQRGGAAFLGWASGNVVPILTVSGLLYYAATRLAAARFYDRFGLRPEDVGLGYPDTIAQTIYAVLYVGLKASVVSAIVYFIWTTGLKEGFQNAYRTMTSSIHSESAPPPKNKGNEKKRSWRQYGRFLLLSFLILTLLEMATAFLYTPGEAESVRDGHPAPADVLSGSWDSQAALVDKIGGDVSASAGCMIYLGRAEGLVVLYDPSSRFTWRVPSGAVTIRTGGELATVERVPDDCPDA